MKNLHEMTGYEAYRGRMNLWPEGRKMTRMGDCLSKSMMDLDFSEVLQKIEGPAACCGAFTYSKINVTGFCCL